MGKYTSFRRGFPPRPWTIHPLWRGIGCVLMIVVPAISFLAAHEIVNGNMRFIQMPQLLLGNIHFPAFFYHIPVLEAIARSVSSYPNPLAVILVGVILLVVITAFMSLVYAIVYRVETRYRMRPRHSSLWK